MFVMGVLIGGAVVAFVAYKIFPKVVAEGLQGIEINMPQSYKNEYETYKNAYEELCKRFTELLDKYEELRDKKGE